MIFTSIYFFVFFTIGFLVYRILPTRWHKGWLLFLSLWFVCTYSISFGLILLILSTLLYFYARSIERAPKRTGLLLGIGITFLALIFIFFGRFDYLFEGLNQGITGWRIDLPLDIKFILAPVGASFLLLQAIAYIVDVHHRRIPARNSWLDVTLYLIYFPKLLAGPIERPGNFFKKIDAPFNLDENKFWRNFYLIFIGFVRKILIADPLMALLPDNVFWVSSTTVGFKALLSLVAFSIGLYHDFAGYSDIARGVSGMFGIDLTVNFRFPFHATSFSEFWRRWHISLSDFLRDYIYYPLSRTLHRKDPEHARIWTLVLPPLATMLVSGLWHGVSWNMLVWGGLHGILMALEGLFRARQKVTSEVRSGWQNTFSALVVFIVFTLLLIPFKAGLSGGWVFIKNMFSGYGSWSEIAAAIQKFFLSFGNPMTLISMLFQLRIIIILIAAIVLDNLLAKGKEEESVMRWPAWVRVVLLSVCTIAMILFSTGDGLQLFIYQGF